MSAIARVLSSRFIRGAFVVTSTPLSPGSARRLATRRLGTPDRLQALRARVDGRIVLVTGASSGIGRESAVRLAEAGATLLLVARSADALDGVVAEITAAGGTAHAYPCDLSDFDQVDALVLKVLDQHGHVDVLVNNAGMSIRRKIQHSQERFQDFERPMHLNYYSAVRLTMGLLPSMVERERGHVINITSWAAVYRPLRFSGYAASKVALEAWSDSAQSEVLKDGVSFSNIRMPLVRTPMISPTELYSVLPALTMDEAASVVCDAVITRARRVTPPLASIIATLDAISPALGDRIRAMAI